MAGVKVALDLINNDSNLLPGYTLHYTFVESEVTYCSIRTVILVVVHGRNVIQPLLFANLKPCVSRTRFSRALFTLGF